MSAISLHHLIFSSYKITKNIPRIRYYRKTAETASTHSLPLSQVQICNPGNLFCNFGKPIWKNIIYFCNNQHIPYVTQNKNHSGFRRLHPHHRSVPGLHGNSPQMVRMACQDTVPAGITGTERSRHMLPHPADRSFREDILLHHLSVGHIPGHHLLDKREEEEEKIPVLLLPRQVMAAIQYPGCLYRHIHSGHRLSCCPVSPIQFLRAHRPESALSYLYIREQHTGVCGRTNQLIHFLLQRNMD